MQRDSTIKEKGITGKSEGQKVALNPEQEIFVVASSHGDFGDACLSVP